MVADIKLSAPQLAKASDADALAVLFCTGENEIQLKPYVCSKKNRSNLINLFTKKCLSKKIWIARCEYVPIAMLVIESRKKGDEAYITEIDYVVVAPEFRGKGVGRILIRRLQSRKSIDSLRTEARNESSKQMLLHCEFQADGENRHSGRPLMAWRRSSTPDLN